MIQKRICLLLCTTVLGLVSKAQSFPPINVVTTPVPFLRLSPDARAGGMGDIGIATSADANSIFWNMAKTPFAAANSGLSVNHNPWLRDVSANIYMTAIAGYKKISTTQAISASIKYFSLGQMQFTDFSGNTLQTFKPREYSIDFGYAQKISSQFGMAVTFRFINSSLANGSDGGDIYKTGRAIAADISMFYNGLNKNGEGFSWGINASNLGSKIGYTDDAKSKDFLPANLGLGVSYTKLIDAENKLVFAVDANKLLVPELEYTGVPNQDLINIRKYREYSVAESWFGKNRSYNVSLGAEYEFKEQFFARAGYFYEDKTQGDRKYVTVGLGVNYAAFGINFSYLIPSGEGTERNPLSNTIRFGLLFNPLKINLKK